MKRTAKVLIPAIAATIAITTANATHPYRTEADSFLAGLLESNTGKGQTEAIRLAIDGDTAPLEAVRNSRNTVPELPPDVTRRQIGERLALFSCERYRDDATPLLVYFHGGGWTIGSINSCSRFCAAMARNGIAVLAADYRLAPEHPFPAGLTDCVTSVKTAIDSLATWGCKGLAVGGDSSGGNLAIATAMSMPGKEIDAIVAFYPVTKCYPDNSPSWEEFGTGCALDSDLMQAFNNAYTTDIHNPLVSPADAADDELRKLPPTLIVAADRDILKDQGAEFARRLKSLGNEAAYELVPGSVHLFITVPGQPSAFGRSVSAATGFISLHTNAAH
ncbi:MAG: alpha/beta hydrolase [Muribaculaceae bacterium]|nr:alpha/beta hydrolase [Muribaculaceae bacterium]